MTWAGYVDEWLVQTSPLMRGHIGFSGGLLMGSYRGN